jgi:hypothetical protein
MNYLKPYGNIRGKKKVKMGGDRFCPVLDLALLAKVLHSFK